LPNIFLPSRRRASAIWKIEIIGIREASPRPRTAPGPGCIGQRLESRSMIANETSPAHEVHACFPLVPRTEAE
jgi:hypothetical protein